MDYTNWTRERQKLKDEVFKELRNQRDRKALRDGRTFKDSVNINPQTLGRAGTITILDPIMLNGWRFQARPSISFGQIMGDSNKPYMCVPSVADWVSSGGIIVGLKLGIYSLMDCPADLVQHTITWIVHGKASVYQGSSAHENWTQQYDLGGADHLQAPNKQVDTN